MKRDRQKVKVKASKELLSSQNKVKSKLEKSVKIIQLQYDSGRNGC